MRLRSVYKSALNLTWQVNEDKIVRRVQVILPFVIDNAHVIGFGPHSHQAEFDRSRAGLTDLDHLIEYKRPISRFVTYLYPLTLIQIMLDSHFPPADAVSLKPMHLRFAYRTIGQPNCRNPF
jgi:hypothetical protein